MRRKIYGTILNMTESEIRNDFAAALRKVKYGTQLSPILFYGFYPEDIKHLAELHKRNRFRKKIEDLLEDCNFHYECGKFHNKEYDEFLTERGENHEARF